MRIVMLLFAFSLHLPARALEGENLLGPGRVNVTVGSKLGLVVVFLSSHCPCSRSHVEALRTMTSDYPQFGFVVVHANTDETRADAAAYFSKKNLPVPVIEDADQTLLNRFGASRTPHAFVIDANDKVLYRGGMSDSHDGVTAKVWPLKDALNDLKAKRPVRKSEARALGCAIARGRRAA